MNPLLEPTTVTPPPVRGYSHKPVAAIRNSHVHESIPASHAMHGNSDPADHEVASSCHPPGIRRCLLPLIIAILLALSMPAFAQQTMMMTYELKIDCQDLPGSSVTITAEALGDLYGPTGTLLDPNDPANYPFFSNYVSSPLDNGYNTDPLIWDFLDDNNSCFLRNTRAKVFRRKR